MESLVDATTVIVQIGWQPLVLAFMMSALAVSLVVARKKIEQNSDNPKQDVINAINDCLPQTQCAQCGHPGCLPYAEAIADGAPINRCPPGGEQTIQTLATLLGRDVAALDPEFGIHLEKRIAYIHEEECIGCTLCIAACPVDAIIGAQQVMHSVLTDVCTGCDLCLPPCPVDCIDMIGVEIDPIETKRLAALTTQTPGPCIRCGECEIICPKDLSPQNLHWQRHSPEAMTQLKLDDCIECRLCDRVCPSAIPLTQQFVDAKQMQTDLAHEQAQASEAEERYKKRQIRLVAAEQVVKTKASKDDRHALLARLRK